MRNLNPWSFAILFISAFAYLAWNNFEIPTIFVSESREIDGHIYDLNVVPGFMGYGYTQVIKYVYVADDAYYRGIKKLDTKDATQAIGNRIGIKFSVNDPDYHEISKFYPGFGSSLPITYFTTKINGYNQIEMTNGIIQYKEFGDSGKVVVDLIGSCIIDKELLTFTPYDFGNSDKVPDYIKFKYQNDESNITLIDMRTNAIYKRMGGGPERLDK